MFSFNLDNAQRLRGTPCCSWCGILEYKLSAGKKLSACGHCKINVYCSKDCQKKDWKQSNHKLRCFTQKELDERQQQLKHDLGLTDEPVTSAVTSVMSASSSDPVDSYLNALTAEELKQRCHVLKSGEHEGGKDNLLPMGFVRQRLQHGAVIISNSNFIFCALPSVRFMSDFQACAGALIDKSSPTGQDHAVYTCRAFLGEAKAHYDLEVMKYNTWFKVKYGTAQLAALPPTHIKETATLPGKSMHRTLGEGEQVNIPAGFRVRFNFHEGKGAVVLMGHLILRTHVEKEEGSVSRQALTLMTERSEVLDNRFAHINSVTIEAVGRKG
jgi:hypothetical protein